MTRRLRNVVLGVMFAGAVAYGQSSSPPPPPGPAPVLSEVDRLKLINASQSVEIWTMRLQSVAAELQKSKAEFDKLVAAVQVPGWELNEKLEYVRKKETPAKR